MKYKSQLILSQHLSYYTYLQLVFFEEYVLLLHATTAQPQEQLFVVWPQLPK